MNLRRREFLKGLLAGGTLVALDLHAATAAGGLSAPSPAAPPVLLVTGTPCDQAFFGAARALLARSGVGEAVILRLGRDELTRPAAMLRALASVRGHTLVGLVEGAQAALLPELWRGAGIAVSCAGEHCAGDVPGSASRHRVLTTPASHGIARALRAAVPSARVEEQALGAPVAALAAVPALTSEWAAATGELLARVAIGSWQPQAPLPAAAAGPAPRAAASRYYASFVLRA